MATPRLGLVVEDKPTELSCTGMQMCGHIAAVRTGLNHTCV